MLPLFQQIPGLSIVFNGVSPQRRYQFVHSLYRQFQVWRPSGCINIPPLAFIPLLAWRRV